MDALLADASRDPGDGLQAVLGERFELWRALVAAVERMGGRGGWRWEGPKHGWSWKSKRAGKPFLTLVPEPGAFRALVVLGRDDAAAAAALPLGPRMRATYDGARQYPDGRWLFQTVETAEDVDDLVLLLRLKLPPTVRARFDALPGAE